MAYNPTLYNPYGQPQPYSWYQPTQVVTAPQSMVQQPVNGLVSVTGIEGARAYQLPPNSRVALFDSNEDILYVKSTDAAGYPTIDEYEFFPRKRRQEDSPSPADYVPRSEFDKLAGTVRDLMSNLGVAGVSDGE